MENNLQFRPPSDSELVIKLLKFVAGKSFPETEIAFADVYSKQPWQLIGECSKKTHYFFTQLKKKKSTDSRFKRTMGDGSWTQQDKGKPILDEDENLVIGYKRSLSYKNRKDSSLNGRWMMKEYFLADFLLNELKSKNNEAKDFVICAIKKNPRSQVRGNNVPSDDVNEYKKFIARVLQESVNVQPLFSEQSMVSETPSASYDVNQTYSNDLFVENREFYEEGDWISLLDFADDDLVPKNCLLSNSGELMGF